jgi:arsenate reductase-like glutaredoxin family protein
MAGKLAKQIFEEHGFDINLIGMKRVHTSRARWLRAYNKDGVLGLIDKRKNNSGMQRKKELSLQEKYERLEAKNNLLQAENELLKKLDAIERGLKRK